MRFQQFLAGPVLDKPEAARLTGFLVKVVADAAIILARGLQERQKHLANLFFHSRLGKNTRYDCDRFSVHIPVNMSQKRDLCKIS